jgi:hypothetical protein
MTSFVFLHLQNFRRAGQNVSLSPLIDSVVYAQDVRYVNQVLFRKGPPPMVKVKVSRNRPGVAQRVPGGLGSQIS